MTQLLPRVNCFLVKVASRCNLNCDYCYVFNHADQTWKSLPRVMPEEAREGLGFRLAEYCHATGIDNVLIIFHGGEPLLMGAQKLVEMALKIQEALGDKIKAEFSLQTNGVLLRKKTLDLFQQHNIGVSLSMDGPREAHDLHRLTHSGASSFDDVMKGYNLLKEYPDVFCGVISVIDVRTSPKVLFEFFDKLSPPQLDFLLPDSNYNTPPPYRKEQPDVYVNWLKDAFDLWFDHYSHIKVRLFDSLLACICGMPSDTDFFGFGDISLLSVETDGSYHDLDVLKITSDGYTSLGHTVFDTPIQNVLESDRIQAHRRLLKKESLCKACQECEVVDICGGGAVPHRFSSKNGFDNPTVYCKEMLSLIKYIQEKMKVFSIQHAKTKSFKKEKESPLKDIPVIEYSASIKGNESFYNVYNQWIEDSYTSFLKVIDALTKECVFKDSFAQDIRLLPKEVSASPSIYLWTKAAHQFLAGKKFTNIQGIPVEFEVNSIMDLPKRFKSLINLDKPNYGSENPWLRMPFGDAILFEDPEFVQRSKSIYEGALDIIKQYSEPLFEEMCLISPEVQPIVDPTAHPDKIVSFSDNMIPGCLYVSMKTSTGLIDPYDLADSLIHEHRHQKLYLLESYAAVVESNTPLVPSPWREEVRPVSGVFHGTYVFYELFKFWEFVEATGGDVKLKHKAAKAKEFSLESLEKAFKTLETCSLTERGRTLINHFKNDTLKKEVA